VWVSGQRRPLALHWDGSVWQRVSLPPLRGEGALLGVVAVAPDDAWAVGTPYGPTGAFTLHWNGVRWKQVRTPTAELLGDVVRLRRRVVAVGIRAHHGSNVPLVEQWSGGRWQVAYATTNKGTVWAAAAAGSVLWGVGAYSIFRWDARWHASRLPLPAAGYATDVTVGFGGTWVVVADEDPRPRSVLARSTGNGWVRAPALAASLAAIDADRERIWAAGTTGDRNGLALGEPLVGAYSC